MADLSFDIVSTLVFSDEEFPIDFEDAWRWIEYSSKQKAVECLESSLDKGLDFLTFGLKNTGKRGRPSRSIRLTIDGFKMFCQAAGTEKGKQVRRYFVECERKLKQRIAEDSVLQRKSQVKAYVLDNALSWDSNQSGQRPFTAEFYQHLYRIRGGDWAKRNPAISQRPSCVGNWTNKFVYDLFPGEVPKSLRDKYKSQEGNYRKYEFLTQNIGRTHLVAHMASLIAIMRISPNSNWDRFRRSIERAFADPNTVSAIQLEFDFMIEMEEEYMKQFT